jgi:rSAM/selenodomain-associated transferase 2
MLANRGAGTKMMGFFGGQNGAKGSHRLLGDKQSYGCSTISVIIPTLNEGQYVLSAIQSAIQPPRKSEIIVVDGGSTDDTVKITRAYAVVIKSPRGRAVQMNAGARHSTGNVLLFLHADSCLPPLALANLEQVMADPQIVGGTFTLRFNHSKWLLRLIAFFSRFKFRYFHYGDQGIFVRRDIFEQLGGFKEIPIMEDLDFLRRLRARGRVALIKLPITTSARRFLENGILRHQLLNIVLVILYLLGTKPQALSRLYERTDDQRLGQRI